MASAYDSERLAAGYAFDRPPIHEHILRSARLYRPADQALDVGCGAGLSTAALALLARRVIGLEPIPAMLAHRRTVAPHARFVIGQAERLPFAAASFDLVAAAGSLNYTDLPSALAEIARVLTPDGTFVLYDFSVGRRSASGDELAGWFASFEQRFPWPPGWQPFDGASCPSSSMACACSTTQRSRFGCRWHSMLTSATCSARSTWTMPSPAGPAAPKRPATGAEGH